MTANPVDLAADNLADYGTWLDGASEITKGWDLEQLQTFRARLEEAKKQLDGAIATVMARMLPLIETGSSSIVPGAGVAVVSQGSKQSYRGALLASRVAARVADEAMDGDEPIPPGPLCQRVADEIVTVFGLDAPSKAFKKGEAKKRNLNASEFTEYTDGTPTVRWTP